MGFYGIEKGVFSWDFTGFYGIKKRVFSWDFMGFSFWEMFTNIYMEIAIFMGQLTI